MTKSADKKIYRKHRKYFLYILLKNKFIVSMMIIFCALPSLLQVFMGDSIIKSVNNSLILIGSVHLTSIILIISMSIILFSKTKGNNIDLYLHVSGIGSKKIITLKQTSIYIVSMTTLLGLLASSIIQMTVIKDSSFVFMTFAINFLSIILLNIFWVILFTFICYNSKILAGSFISVILGMLFVLLTFSQVLKSSSAYSSNEFNPVENQNSIINVEEIVDGNVTDSFKSIYKNPSAHNNNSVNLSNDDGVMGYIPTDITMGFAPTLLTNIYKKQTMTLNNLRDRFSLIKNVLSSEQDNLKMRHNYLIMNPSHNSIFSIKDRNEQIKVLMDEIQSIKGLKLEEKHKGYWKMLENKLKSTNIWMGNLMTENDRKIIDSLTGIHDANSYLYEIFKYSDFNRNISLDLFKELKQKTSGDFTEFVKFILGDALVKQNIYAYKSFGDFNSIKKYHPSYTNFDEYKTANKYDIDFIKNRMFHLNLSDTGSIESIKVLVEGNVYKTITGAPFGNITLKNKGDWDNYINTNNEVVNLESIINKVKLADPNMIDFKFMDNISDVFKINEKLSITMYNKRPLTWLYTTIMFSVLVLAELMMLRKSSRKDMKYE